MLLALGTFWPGPMNKVASGISQAEWENLLYCAKFLGLFASV